jgi:hypothetical protein
MNKCIRENLYDFLGDITSITSCSNLPDCTRVAILQFKDTVEGLSGDLFHTFVKRYFASTYRPIRKLDSFITSAVIRTVEFQITERELGEYCSVTPSAESTTILPGTVPHTAIPNSLDPAQHEILSPENGIAYITLDPAQV